MSENLPQRRALLMRKIDTLRRLRTDSDLLFRRLEQELTTNASQVQNRARTIDAIGTVATVAVSVGSLVRKGFTAMHLTGDALAKVNRELGKDALHVAYDPARDILADQAGDRLGAHKGVQHYFGTAFHVFANLTTPSYWAAVYINTKDKKSLDQIVNSRAETLIDDPLRQIREQHTKTLDRIDQEIRRTEALLRRPG